MFTRRHDTFILCNNPGSAYQETGRIAEAITWYEQNLADLGRVLDATHPKVKAVAGIRSKGGLEGGQ